MVNERRGYFGVARHLLIEKRRTVPFSHILEGELEFGAHEPILGEEDSPSKLEGWDCILFEIGLVVELALSDRDRPLCCVSPSDPGLVSRSPLLDRKKELEVSVCNNIVT